VLGGETGLGQVKEVGEVREELAIKAG